MAKILTKLDTEYFHYNFFLFIHPVVQCD